MNVNFESLLRTIRLIPSVRTGVAVGGAISYIRGDPSIANGLSEYGGRYLRSAARGAHR